MPSVSGTTRTRAASTTTEVHPAARPSRFESMSDGSTIRPRGLPQRSRLAAKRGPSTKQWRLEKNSARFLLLTSSGVARGQSQVCKNRVRDSDKRPHINNNGLRNDGKPARTGSPVRRPACVAAPDNEHEHVQESRSIRSPYFPVHPFGPYHPFDRHQRFGRRHPFGRYHPPSGLGADAGVDDAGENSRDESNADAVTSVAMG